MTYRHAGSAAQRLRHGDRCATSRMQARILKLNRVNSAWNAFGEPHQEKPWRRRKMHARPSVANCYRDRPDLDRRMAGPSRSASH